ncbi:hypothetical protein BDV33DRAFT_177533 [Aspergillus novoparasiticus]|uniref:Uncharacterized protein n=1 Tax=Aspergillus novoparasiticus TaxID=986946 RepID=A0A5N6EHW5_9EURO|nr:hypothetical protein BDV33DRAFT_177533 [Aspergillus novoparasiticus]
MLDEEKVFLGSVSTASSLVGLAGWWIHKCPLTVNSLAPIPKALVPGPGLRQSTTEL